MEFFLTGLGILVLILLAIFYLVPLFGTWITTILAVRKDGFSKKDSWVIWLLVIVAVIPTFNIFVFIFLLYALKND